MRVAKTQMRGQTLGRTKEAYVHYTHYELVEGADTYYNRYCVGAYTTCTSSSVNISTLCYTNSKYMDLHAQNCIHSGLGGCAYVT